MGQVAHSTRDADGNWESLTSAISGEPFGKLQRCREFHAELWLDDDETEFYLDIIIHWIEKLVY